MGTRRNRGWNLLHVLWERIGCRVWQLLQVGMGGGGGGGGDMGKEEFNLHSCNGYRSSLSAVDASRALPLVSLRDLPDGL